MICLALCESCSGLSWRNYSSRCKAVLGKEALPQAAKILSETLYTIPRHREQNQNDQRAIRNALYSSPNIRDTIPCSGALGASASGGASAIRPVPLGDSAGQRRVRFQGSKGGAEVVAGLFGCFVFVKLLHLACTTDSPARAFVGFHGSFPSGPPACLRAFQSTPKHAGSLAPPRGWSLRGRSRGVCIRRRAWELRIRRRSRQLRVRRHPGHPTHGSCE